MNILFVQVFVIALLCYAAESRQRKTTVAYPLSPIVLHTHNFTSNITKNSLTCFGNRQFKSPTFVEVPFALNGIALVTTYGCLGASLYCFTAHLNR